MGLLDWLSSIGQVQQQGQDLGALLAQLSPPPGPIGAQATGVPFGPEMPQSMLPANLVPDATPPWAGPNLGPGQGPGLGDILSMLGQRVQQSLPPIPQVPQQALPPGGLRNDTPLPVMQPPAAPAAPSMTSSPLTFQAPQQAAGPQVGKISIPAPAAKPGGPLGEIAAYGPSLGLPVQAAAAVAGNFMHESGMVADAGLGNNDQGGGKDSRGFGQWDPKRWANYQAFTKEAGLDMNDPKSGLAFFKAEATNPKYYDEGAAKAWGLMQNPNNTVAENAKIFAQHYERPASVDATLASRVQHSENAFAQANGQAGPPRAPTLVTPNLPIPAAVIPGAPQDVSWADRYEKSAPRSLPEMSTSDRLTNILARAALGAKGATNVGDVLLGAGGGAAQGAAENIAQARGEAKRVEDLRQEFERGGVNVGAKKAGVQQANQDLPITAQNQTNQNLQQVALAQEKINAELKNRQIELQHDIDYKLWQENKPQIIPGKDGQLFSITKKSDGSADITTVDTGGLHSSLDQLKAWREGMGGGKDNPLNDPMEYQILEKQLKNQPGALQQIVTQRVLKDEVANGNWKEFLGSQAKDIEKKADAGLDPGLRGNPEKYNAARNDRIFNLLMEQRAKDPTKFDQTFLPFAQKKQNYGALRYFQRGG